MLDGLDLFDSPQDFSEMKTRARWGFFDVFEKQKDTVDEKLSNEEWPELQLLTFEKQSLGFNISSHPLAQHSVRAIDLRNSGHKKIRRARRRKRNRHRRID